MPLNVFVERGQRPQLLNFETQTGEGYSNVVSGIQASVSVQQSLRSAALGNQGEQPMEQPIE